MRGGGEGGWRGGGVLLTFSLPNEFNIGAWTVKIEAQFPNLRHNA